MAIQLGVVVSCEAIGRSLISGLQKGFDLKSQLPETKNVLMVCPLMNEESLTWRGGFCAP